jgi:tetratricopeptide (TPR) repeat protein
MAFRKMKSFRSTSDHLNAILSWVAVMAAAGLAVSNQAWAQTFLIAAAGGICLLFPPSTGLPKPLLVLMGLILALSSTAFLPADWFSAGFRRPFLDHRIALPATLSPQPWLTLEDVTLLLATMVWGWLCFEAHLPVEQRRFFLAAYLLGTGVLALNLILQGTVADVILPAWMSGAGQFENRNQTGDLLLMSGIFSASRGFSELARRNFLGLLWIVLSAVFLIAIIRNGSRTAVVLFAVGLLLLWVLRPGFRRQRWLIQATVLLVFAGAPLLLVAGHAELRDRFLVLLDQGREDRLPIYRDTIRLLANDPWCGVGLGNFEGVFNVQRHETARLVARCLHPDSDWFWLAAELGVGGVVLFALLIAMTFKGYLRKTPFPGLTNASMIVAVLFLIHSLFDVGGHRLGTVWACLYLTSLGAYRSLAPTEGTRWRIGARLIGLVLLIVAGLRVQSMSLHPWMPTRASIARVERTLSPALPLSEQEQLLDQSIGWAPLHWPSYYRRALLRLSPPETVADANADFNRTLFLEQNSTELPRAIGDACRASDLPESLVAWRELLRRAGDRRIEFLEELYAVPGLEAKTRLQMATLAGDDPNLQVVSIISQEPSEFTWMCQNFLTDNPSLDGVTPVLSRNLFNRWVDAGDPADLIAQWSAHPEWLASGWGAYARALAKAGRYQEAVGVALRQMPAPPMPSVRPQDLPEALRQAEANPQDVFCLIQLYFAQSAAGDWAGALATLQTAEQLPRHPDYIPYLLAKALSATGQDQSAWPLLAPMIP